MHTLQLFLKQFLNDNPYDLGHLFFRKKNMRNLQKISAGKKSWKKSGWIPGKSVEDFLIESTKKMSAEIAGKRTGVLEEISQ